MEIVDILVRLIDATTDRFHLQDVGICQFSVKNRNGDNALEIVRNYKNYSPLGAPYFFIDAPVNTLRLYFLLPQEL